VQEIKNLHRPCFYFRKSFVNGDGQVRANLLLTLLLACSTTKDLHNKSFKTKGLLTKGLPTKELLTKDLYNKRVTNKGFARKPGKRLAEI
jgi:hypothetical protein